MEYAHHGNLKDYLEHCKADLLQRNVSIHVGTEEGKPNTSKVWGGGVGS